MRSILQDNFDNDFTICKRKREQVDALKSSIIISSDIEEIKQILSILKQSVSIYLPDFNDNSDFFQWLKNKTYEDVKQNLKKATPKQIMALCDRIGIPLKYSNILLSSSSKADQALVHKISNKNIMVSKSERIGGTNVFYLRGYFKTGEIILDHEAKDHVESILLAEICRQACLATSEVALKGEMHYMIPTEEYKVYKKFVSLEHPLLIQVISGKTRKYSGYYVFALYQNNECCLKGYMLGRIFKNRIFFKEIRERLDE
ncbi:hypothetical protein SMU26_02023 [Streptococcus mutans 3SN1]|uniref:AfsA-related hotdog domain-containing protein n=1 Tax=Streptococcus mutans TaxID=1309 RepID=UPI0002B5C3E6|nr:AfsA-related hotdog domain-containing protein [Streptococcus mutans]EMB67588.1 hypothetical protein SMU26_02023 [Streptococcus mutans 3SN1]